MNILPGSYSSQQSGVAASAERIILIPVKDSIPHLLRRLLERAGVSSSEAARRLGVVPNTIRQYYRFNAPINPGLVWFIRFCEALGARVVVEFPEKQV